MDNFPITEWIYCEINKNKQGENKKKPIGISLKWSRDVAVAKMESIQAEGTQCLGPCRVFKLNGIVCIDIDEDVPYEKVIEHYPFLQGHLTCNGNTKGFHIYVRSTAIKQIDCLAKIKGDIITDQMFELEKETFGKLQDLDPELIKSMKKVKLDFDTVSILTNSESFTPFHRAIVDNINPELYTSYDKWKLFIGALGQFDGGLELANEYSKKLSNYVSKKDVEKHMTYTTSFGFLVNLSKKSNLFNHKIIVGEKFLNNAMTDYSISEIATYLIDDIIKVNDELYHYNIYWKKDTSKGETETRKKVIDILRSFFKFHLKQTLEKLALNLEPDSEEYKSLSKRSAKYGSAISDIEKSTNSKHILDMYRINLPCSDIQFDKNPYLFCFKNCAFDLRTNKAYEVKREDYITIHLPYDYVKSTEDQIDKIHGLFNSILKGEPLECYLSILRSAMIGISYEYFVMLNGSGGNG